MPLERGYSLIVNRDFQHIVVAGAYKAAADILAEPDATPNHVARVKLALNVLDEEPGSVLFQRVTKLAAQNAAIQAANPGAWPDNDVISVVSSILATLIRVSNG